MPLRTVFVAALSLAFATGHGAHPDQKTKGHELRLSAITKEFSKVSPQLQTQNQSCGISVVAALLSHFLGRPVSDAEILRKCDGRNGRLGLDDLAVVVSKFGFETAYGKTDLDRAEAWMIEYDQPMILHFNENGGHFVLLLGRIGKEIFIWDPAVGKRVLPMSKFTRVWSGYGLGAHSVAKPTKSTSNRSKM